MSFPIQFRAWQTSAVFAIVGAFLPGCQGTDHFNQTIHITKYEDSSRLVLAREPFTLIIEIPLCPTEADCGNSPSIVASTEQSIHNSVRPGVSTEDLPFAHGGALAVGDMNAPLVVSDLAPGAIVYSLTYPEMRSVELLDQTEQRLRVAWHISEIYFNSYQVYRIEDFPYDSIFLVYFYDEAYMDMFEAPFELKDTHFKRLTIQFK